MRALKLLVIAMGVLLVGGTVALVIAVSGRIAHSPATVNAGLPRHVALPAGARIVSAKLSGDRILVRLALAGGGEQLVLLDARTGSQLAVIEVPDGH
jgi:hypothetical protein